MSKPKVTLIDYGLGNLLSVQRGLEYCGAKVLVTSDPEAVLSAERVVLPGVGAFANGMQALHERGLAPAIQSLEQKRTPLLGICLGMQLLLDESEEFCLTKGLGLIPGRVVRIPITTTTGNLQKIPHIGWNELMVTESRPTWKGTLFQNIDPGSAVYFVHSFMSLPANPAHRVAECLYGGHQVVAGIVKDNITGCQFHPEKSGEVGLEILSQFCAC